jgi:hypothetical protein
VFSAPLLGEMLGFPERTLARSHLPKQPGEHDASVVLPGDPRFGAVTRGFNQRWRVIHKPQRSRVLQRLLACSRTFLSAPGIGHLLR